MKHVYQWMTALFAFCLLGCTRSANEVHLVAVTNQAAISLGPSRLALNVWCVETDGRGHRGYACSYTSRGVFHPGGNGLFQSLEALRTEIHSSGHSDMWVVSELRSIVPDRWKIRELTPEELSFLRSGP
jgi:hypothetical protein